MDRFFPTKPNMISKFFTPIWVNLKNWSCEYSILPLTLASVVGAAYFAYLLTGRAPKNSGGWLVDYSARSIVIALAITFTSTARQCFGQWYK
jgi:hypothetical protein